MKVLIDITGHWEDDPQTSFDMIIDSGEWDGDENDPHVFFYMDNEPIKVGDVISDGFVVDSINCVR